MVSAKVFSKVRSSHNVECHKTAERPALNSYKREFSMPDHFYIPVQSPNRNQRATTQHQRTRTVDVGDKSGDDGVVVMDEGDSPVRQSIADSLLSKHNGWITIDDENMDRKQAPETFQNTNPVQRNRLKPTWMRTSAN